MGNPNYHQIWEISLITPLHVGDGQDIERNMDYVPNKGALTVYHPESIFSALADNPRALAEVGHKGFNLAQFFKEYKIAPAPQYRLPFKGTVEPEKVRRFIKNGYGLPYLTGTTLKGGIRTALWTNLDRSGLPPINQKQKFKNAVKKVSGANPHHDFLRPLKISDSAPIIPEGSLEAIEIKWLNLNHDKQGGWRDFTSKKTFPDNNQAKGLYVEALKSGTKLYASATLSEFLTSAPIRASKEIQSSKDLSGLKAASAAINQHSQKIAGNEKTFFQKAGTNANAAAAFYEGLIRQMEQETEGFFVRIAWGGGWRFMTGDWISPKDLETLRSVIKLGKQGAEIFPKTRRLAVKDGFPQLPLGWVKIRTTEPDAFERAIRAAADYDIPTTDSPKTHTAAPALTQPAVDPEQARQEKLAQFKQVVNKETNLPGAIQSYQAQIAPLEDTKLKQEMCRILMQKALSQPKQKKFSKALKEGKAWALLLKQLCETCGLDAAAGQEGKA